MKPDMEALHEQMEMIKQMRSELGDKKMGNVTDMRLRQSMINEYQTFTTVASQLLRLFTATGLVETLTGEQHRQYQGILEQLTDTANKCNALVEASHAIDSETLLASMSPADKTLH